MKIGMSLMSVLAIAALVLVGCEKAEDTATKVQQGASEAAKDAGTAAKEAGAAVAEKAGEVAAAVTEQAQKLYDQAKQYIDEKKLDEAAKAITSLDALKSKLPAEWAAKIDDLKKLLDSAKAAVGGAPAPGH